MREKGPQHSFYLKWLLALSAPCQYATENGDTIIYLHVTLKIISTAQGHWWVIRNIRCEISQPPGSTNALGNWADHGGILESTYRLIYFRSIFANISFKTRRNVFTLNVTAACLRVVCIRRSSSTWVVSTPIPFQACVKMINGSNQDLEIILIWFNILWPVGP